MSRCLELFPRIAALFVVFAAVAAADQTIAVGVYDYQVTRSFSLPTPINMFGQVLYDTLPDGRLLLLNETTVSVETGLKTGTFNTLGNIAGFLPSFGPSFLAVSPDGTHAVAGTGGNSVTVFDTSNPLSTMNYTIADFSGDWIDNRYLAIANATSSTVSRVQLLDTVTSAAVSVVDNIRGASAGVAFDSAGNLYTGNGFDTLPGGSSAGWIKAFSAASWQNAFATNTPLDFEASGTPIADLLSAYPIGFDGSGNMFVGGSDHFGSGDSGYAALIDAAAVGNALAVPQATPPITPSSSAAVLRKLLSPSPSDSPYWNYNAATGELYLSYAFGDGHVDVYTAVPEPSCILLVVVSGMLFLSRRLPRA
jgi:hypothetical protein